MSRIRFGVVVEGPTDCIVLDKLVSSYIGGKALGDVSISFHNLQPFVDNTSKSGYSEGGWELVYKWCLNNPPQYRRNLYLSLPLFADEMDQSHCDALLIHLDSDICEAIGDKSSITPVPKKTDPSAEKGEFISRVLSEWLWGEGEIDAEGHVLVPAVDSIEAWLVAGLSTLDPDPESHPNIQRRLAEVSYQLYRGRAAPATMKRLSKSIHDYVKMGNDAAAAVQRIIATCPHFRIAMERVVDVVGHKMPKAV